MALREFRLGQYPWGGEGVGLGPEWKRHGAGPGEEVDGPASVPWGEVGGEGHKEPVQCAQGWLTVRKEGDGKRK